MCTHTHTHTHTHTLHTRYTHTNTHIHIQMYRTPCADTQSQTCNSQTNKHTHTHIHTYTHTHIHTHTYRYTYTNRWPNFFPCVLVCVRTTVATCVCIRSEDTHKSKRFLTEDTHHVISWTDDTHMFQTTGDFITKSIFSRISNYVTRLRFRYVTPWILARFHEKNNNISWTSLP